MTAKRILILEDEPMIAQLLAEMLSILECEFTLCTTGEEAILAVQKAPDTFNAAILDLTIDGGMDGHETGQHLHEHAPELPLIVSSGRVDDPIMRDCNAHGFSAVLKKPYRFDELNRVLQKVLSGAPPLV